MRSLPDLRKSPSLVLCKGCLYVKRCVILVVLVCGIVPFHTGLASSCGRPFLQQSYDSSKYIVIAKLAVCTKTTDASNRYCQEWELEIDEILKGDSPPKKLRASPGFDPPRTGDIRLLFYFFDEGFIAGSECGPGGVLNRKGSERVQETADRLRKYHDGVVADLPEPWRFGKIDNNCFILHRFEHGFISLQYDLSRNAIERNTPGLVVTADGVRFEPQSPRLSINFDNYGGRWTAGDPSIKIGQQVWPLENPTPGWSILSPDNMKVIARDKMNRFVRGEAVMDILGVMTPPAAITICARHGPAGSRVKSNKPAYVDYEVKMTHMNQATQQFRECMALGAAGPTKATNKKISDLW